MATNQDGRLENQVDEEIVEFNEAPPVEDNAPRGYEDYVNNQEPEEQEVPEEDDVPEKYRGKSVKDIIAMHQNAEKLLGKQSSEVGDLRKVVDDFIQSQTIAQQQQQQAPETSELDELDFFENPAQAVSKIVENHPTVRQSRELAQQLSKQEALSALKNAHPDYQQIVADSQFAEWVGKSKIRSELLRKADQQFDFESANELFSLWKERQNIVNDTVRNETQARKQSVKSGATGSAKGSAERPSRKIYRRADIVELMTKNPERYQAMAEEIRMAYAEGRVK